MVGFEKFLLGSHLKNILNMFKNFFIIVNNNTESFQSLSASNVVQLCEFIQFFEFVQLHKFVQLYEFVQFCKFIQFFESV